MLTVEIRRPEGSDSKELNDFFHLVLTDTFEKEGISHLTEDREQEFQGKLDYLRSDLASNGRDRRFYLAIHQGRIIGTIESGPSSKLIRDLTKGELEHLPEIGTIFVHPDFQGRGVANRLLEAAYRCLLGRGIAEFCLDSGYKNAQRIWTKKFGAPAYVFPDYWGNGTDHMIWRSRIEAPLT
ncbi:GNAT family N-acetyltransferase [Cohnella sp. AR92]|uniref:GNAT family N-acetyltransferase n=1 Tax=Cohnella sp. AR92 TaxID=648716 RepID=UPI000F8F14B7|nr:GNAT family N-acetyltransferase [Cohnella sp. AR92]RUS46214.1 GNAT family N-acetyltransferase [Cohnella sp. AR92]